MLSGGEGEVRVPENVKEQIETVVCPEEDPALPETTMNGT